MGKHTEIQWCPVLGIKGWEVNRHGEMRSFRYGKSIGRGRGTVPALRDLPHLLKPYVSKQGYRCVGLKLNGAIMPFKVCRLVLLAFVGKCPLGMECCHKDGDKLNDSLRNLKWGTSLENSQDQYRHGTRIAGPRHPQSKLTSDEVHEIRRLCASGKFQRIVARQFGIRQSVVSSIVNFQHRITVKEERGN